MYKKPIIDICLPVYNEEKNIFNIIDQIFKQECNIFSLREVAVYCDGCTDKTVEILSESKYRYPKLKIFNFRKRKGKLYRLNQIYRNFESDILVILDADIGLDGKKFLSRLIKPIINSTDVLMVASNEIPIRPKNFIGKVIYQSFVNWDNVCSYIPKLDSVHSFGGAATAYERSFAKKLSIPNEVREERMYLYLSAKIKNGYFFNKNAKIFYLPVSSFKDLKGLMKRSFGDKDVVLDKIFGIDTNKNMDIPLKYKIKGVKKAILSNPFYAVLGLILNLIIAKVKIRNSDDKSQLWEFSESTKRVINTTT